MIPTQENILKWVIFLLRNPAHKMDKIRRRHAGIAAKLVDLVAGSFNE